MHKLTRDKVCYAMSAENDPVLRVAAGESICIQTEDCYSGNLKTSADMFTKQMWPMVNPATGPIFIEGTSPGDVLRVKIERIDVADKAVMNLSAGMGALAERIGQDETVVMSIRDGKLIVSDTLSIPVQPMIGVIGTVPAGEAVPNGTPGEHGGNMDCKEIAAGATVYLPVNTHGALLSLGDLHAVMGDGEVCVCGAEVRGEVTVTADISPVSLPTPAVANAEHLMFIGSAESLDDCESIVLDKAHRFLTCNVGLGANEAARLMSLVGELRVCQVVDPLKTMKFMLPKAVLACLGWP